MSPNITLRSLTEHCPSSRYNNNFGIKNIGSISHLMNFESIIIYLLTKFKIIFSIV